jgi:transcriptional regulator with XRE-family HTH domain
MGVNFVYYTDMGNPNQQPYAQFGDILKAVMADQHKSVADVCGAVEISKAQLESYEKGETRPSEDILMLLIQHFGLKDAQADEFWQLAGYGKRENVDVTRYFMNDDFGSPKELQTVLLDPDDAKIVYTDMVQVMVNNYGVIVNFMQGAGPNNQPLAISRVGMSKEHARSVLELLQKTLEQADELSANKPTAQLPAPKKEKE